MEEGGDGGKGRGRGRGRGREDKGTKREKGVKGGGNGKVERIDVKRERWRGME
jgi:hypothetical protein